MSAVVSRGRIAGFLSQPRGWVAASLKEDHVTDLKAELHRKLQAGRAGLLSKLEGLTEYDSAGP